MNTVELFSGSGTISKAFKSRGHSTFQIDIRKRKGICEPDLRADIGTITPKDIPFSNVHFVWCSFPCQTFSYAAGDYHFKYGEPVSDQAHVMLKLLTKTLNLITELQPDYYFIENPRGHLRYQKILLDWLTRNHGMTKELTYSSYGFPSTNPTNIFTNAHNWLPKPLNGYGRGNKSPLQMFDNLTVCQKQKVPGSLAEDIVTFCEKTIPALNFLHLVD